MSMSCTYIILCFTKNWCSRSIKTDMIFFKLALTFLNSSIDIINLLYKSLNCAYTLCRTQNCIWRSVKYGIAISLPLLPGPFWPTVVLVRTPTESNRTVWKLFMCNRIMRKKNFQETTTQKMQIWMYNECDSLISGHRITQDESTCH